MVSLVTHLGPSQNCGHYTAIGQAPNGNYYQFDDSCVRPLPLSAVLGTNTYIMFFEKDNTADDHSVPTASTSSVVYGPQLPDNIINRDKSPTKSMFFRNENRKLGPLNSTSVEGSKLETKPVILNSTLSKATDSCNMNTEPWVVKQNGDVEKVVQTHKILNGTDKLSSKVEDDKKVSFIIKRQIGDECHVKQKCSKNETELRLVVDVKSTATSKLVKTPKSPLEKLEEQMKKSDAARNGSSGTRLVPYDSESSGDERGDRASVDGQRRRPPLKKSTHRTWTISTENGGPLLSPSLNGVTTKE